MRKILFLFLALIVLAPACEAHAEDGYTALFTRYFAEKIKAESILPVISAGEDDLRRGRIPNLTVCIEGAPVGGVVYERLLLVLTDVLFTRDQNGVKILSHRETKLSGNITKGEFLATLKRGMPHFAVSELSLKDGAVTVKGVYEKKLTFRMRALIRCTGRYVTDKRGVAKIRFDEATNDNPLLSARDISASLAKAAPILSFSSFYVQPRVDEVRVDHDMVWFSAR